MKSLKLVMAGSFITSFRMLTGAIHVHYLLVTGVGLRDLALLQIVYSVTVLLGEMPTGILADQYSRKFSVLMACVLFCAFYILCFFSPLIYFLYLSEICYGLAICLISGALSAWLTTSIKEDFPHEDRKINEYFHLKGELSALGSAVCGVLGATALVVFHKNFEFVYVLSCICFAALAIYIGKIPYRHHPHNPLDRNKRYILSSWHELKVEIRKKTFLLFILTSMLLAGIFQPMAHYWQPYFTGVLAGDLRAQKFFHEPSVLLGTVFLVYCVTIYLANRWAKYLLSRAPSRHPFFLGSVAALLGVLISGGFLLLENFLVWAMISFAMLHGAFSVTAIVSHAQYAKHAPEDKMATLLSINSLMGRLSSIMILASIAMTIHHHPLHHYLAFNALGFALISILMFYGLRIENK